MNVSDGFQILQNCVPGLDEIQRLDDTGSEHTAHASKEELQSLTRLSLTCGHRCEILYYSKNFEKRFETKKKIRHISEAGIP